MGGSFDPAAHTVTLAPGSREARIILGPAGRPDVSVQAQSTAPGPHTLPLLTAGTPATVSASVTGTGQAPLSSVRLSLHTPPGWTVHATTPTSFGSLKPGQQATARWLVTRPAAPTVGPA